MELRYYFTHCVKGEDGGWVSREMRYPLSTHFSVLDSAPGGGQHAGRFFGAPTSRVIRVYLWTVGSIEKFMGRYLKP